MGRLWTAILVIACATPCARAADDDIMRVIEKLDPDNFAISPDEARSIFAKAYERLKREPNALALGRLKVQDCYWQTDRWSTKPEDVLAFVHAARKDVEAANDPKAVADLQMCEAATLRDSRNYADSITRFKEVANSPYAIKDGNLRAYALRLAGDTEGSLGRHSEGLADAKEAYAISERLGNRLDMANALTIIAELYNHLGEYDKAIEYYKTGLAEQQRAGDVVKVRIITNNMGMIYDTMGKPKEALELLNRALELAREQKNTVGELGTLNLIGRARIHLGQYKEAIAVLEGAIARWEKVGNIPGLATARSSRGLALVALQHPEAALRDLDFAYETYAAHKHLPGLQKIHEGRAQAYSQLGQWENAYREDVALRDVSDKIAARDRQAIDTRLRVEFDTTRKEKENELLQREKKLLEASDAAKAGELRQANEVRRWQTAAIALAVVLLAGMSMLLLRLRKQALRIRQQKTEVERALTDLQHAQQQLVLREKMASIGTLTAGVAHEINNPANFAHVGAQALAGDLQRFREFLVRLAGDAGGEVTDALNGRVDALTEQVDTIVEGTTRIRDLVKDLRTFSRLDEADRKQAAIADSIVSTVNLVRAQYAHVAQIHCKLDVNPVLECWPAQLNQVFMNVIVNACQAVERRQKDSGNRSIGAVHLRNRIAGDWLEIDFEDDGCGMSPSVLEHVFEPFYTTKEVGDGVGLGMSISFGIVQKHGGDIRIRSVEGQGTCVTVRLPLVSEAVLS